MAADGRILRLFFLAGVDVDESRASLVVDRLAARRLVKGEAPEWWVLVEEDDTSAAMRRLDAELSELDPVWMETFDFEAMPSRPPREAEFG